LSPPRFFGQSRDMKAAQQQGGSREATSTTGADDCLLTRCLQSHPTPPSGSHRHLLTHFSSSRLFSPTAQRQKRARRLEGKSRVMAEREASRTPFDSNLSTPRPHTVTAFSPAPCSPQSPSAPPSPAYAHGVSADSTSLIPGGACTDGGPGGKIFEFSIADGLAEKAGAMGPLGQHGLGEGSAEMVVGVVGGGDERGRGHVGSGEAGQQVGAREGLGQGADGGERLEDLLQGEGADNVDICSFVCFE